MALEPDQEFSSALGPLLKSQEGVPKPKVHDVDGRRAIYAAISGPRPTIPEGVSFEILKIPRQDQPFIAVYHFKPTSQRSDSSFSAAVIHMHGGGLIALSPEINVSRLAANVLATGVQAFSVDYRLAPEHPYPAALDDCWDTLSWIHQNSQALQIDPSRIAVMGESAGAGLAAALAIRARDSKLSPPIARQILSSPMLDDRTRGEVPGEFKLWDEDDNLTGWTAYLGELAATDAIPATAAPGRLENVMGLPRLYLDTSQFDLFAKENLGYVQKFLQAGIEVEFHLWPGLPHGFDGLLPTHRVSIELEENRNRILKSL